MPKSLAWGETPWDTLDRDALLREVQRMYDALGSAYSVLNGLKTLGTYREPQHPYWTHGGVGGRAWEKCRQIIKGTEAEYDAEDIYRSFFRYATDLLFTSSPEYQIGWGWLVCDGCGQMLAESPGDGNPRLQVIGEPPHIPGHDLICQGKLRALTWDDLKPQKKK